ncbi:MAG: 50S ribosomal protein L18 [Acidimicrobiaceae bacterium]|nr:50S ribosomal protein L18 [Acidimicrobiaceae bacterium]
MSTTTHSSQALRQKRHARVRKLVVGSSERPRLAVFRSNKHIVAQLIDDSASKTLASASTVEGEFKGKATGNSDAARKVGEVLASRAKEKGISVVVFDRGGFKYHGRVAALADGARAGGLEF